MARVRDFGPPFAVAVWQRRTASSALLIWTIAGLVALVISLAFAPVRTWTGDSLVLPALALATQFLPIPMLRRGWSLRLTMPFLAGTAVIMGPSAALITDLLLVLASGFAFRSGRRTILANVAVAALAGGLVTLFLSMIGSWGAMAVGFAYLLVHTASNLLIAEGVERTIARKRTGDWRKLFPGWLLLSLYILLTLAVAQISSVGAFGYLVLTMAPVLALRAFFQHRWSNQRRSEECVAAISQLLQTAHPGTHRHLERVADLSEEVAKLLGLSARRAELVRLAAILHDVGKVAIDEEVLDKPGKLTEEEFEHVKAHSVYGEQILAEVEGLGEVATWIRHHHERPDGKGYPDGLTGEAIPIESRIVAVVDAFDAMTGGIDGTDRRPYKEPMSPAAAMAELERCASAQFDSRVVIAFKHALIGGLL